MLHTGIRDAHLMRTGLDVGERSAIFKHGSSRNKPLDEAGVGAFVDVSVLVLVGVNVAVLVAVGVKVGFKYASITTICIEGYQVHG